ncbi:MAG TPA: type II toxin-antitoxin system death-on-curing family toxin [Candidatus Tetragenococcus pullicola]|nr:type II toxin-antitoxin system death-on-curing family toxin [Candidatus Tetragenococcus pullicola]
MFSKAGILFITLATKHPFFNGSKLTAWTAMDVFLKMNGYTTTFSDNEAIEVAKDFMQQVSYSS